MPFCSKGSIPCSSIMSHLPLPTSKILTPLRSTLPLQCLQEPFVRSLSSYHFHGATSPFDRRITCLEWHPTHPSTVAVGSKGGDLYLWDFEVPSKKTFSRGVRSYVPLQFIVPPSETTSFP